jgi:hypothetical protein
MSSSVETDEKAFKDARSRDAYREELSGEIPRWYSPLGHVAATFGAGALAIGAAAIKVKAPLLSELTTIPLVLVLSNFGEWQIHKRLLHRKIWPLQTLYKQHTAHHHRIYRYRDMEIRGNREIKFVLIPAVGVAGVIILAVAPAALLSLLVSSNVGWLFFGTTAAYIIAYEGTHLLYHLPESVTGSSRLVRFLKEHHARHHDPRLMQKWNFNVTLPLADWVLRTLAPKELVEKIKKRPAQRIPVSESDKTPRTTRSATPSAATE